MEAHTRGQERIRSVEDIAEVAEVAEVADVEVGIEEAEYGAEIDGTCTPLVFVFAFANAKYIKPRTTLDGTQEAFFSKHPDKPNN